MIFSIVIPAYNEEGAVQDTLRRCLKAGEGLVAAGLGLTEVEVLLVNDGSRDRTEALAREVAGVRVLAHEANKGYGAAIKTGFKASKGEWMGFLDADGTCDPEFFKELLAYALREDVDVAIGSRMHAGSRMPPVRVLGNWIFRTIVNVIGGTRVSDVASGMRVLRRSSLERLHPLPDGLNFTPAMSVRAILDPELAIGELPMPYEERVGESKLDAVKDGLRFLRVILETALTYKPFKFFASTAAILAAASAGFLFLRLGGPSAAPVPFYLAHRYIEQWMFFRLILTSVLLATAVFLTALGLVAQSMVGLINREEDRYGPDSGALGKVLDRFGLLGCLSLAFAVLVNYRPLASYMAFGQIPPEFWVFPVVGAIFVLVGFEFLAFSAMARIARLLWEREKYRRPGD
ncbi:MAG: glycosyltransferase family 2 protein [Elusimicrobiota bacterium]